jgi:hypothetical protein
MTSDLVCHSEERRDEESAFDFSVLIERILKNQSRCFTSVQHDTTESEEGGFETRPYTIFVLFVSFVV